MPHRRGEIDRLRAIFKKPLGPSPCNRPAVLILHDAKNDSADLAAIGLKYSDFEGVFDSQTLADNEGFRGKGENIRLSLLCEKLDVAFPHTHNAGNDAGVTAECTAKLMLRKADFGAQPCISGFPLIVAIDFENAEIGSKQTAISEVGIAVLDLGPYLKESKDLKAGLSVFHTIVIERSDKWPCYGAEQRMHADWWVRNSKFLRPRHFFNMGPSGDKRELREFPTAGKSGRAKMSPDTHFAKFADVSGWAQAKLLSSGVRLGAPALYSDHFSRAKSPPPLEPSETLIYDSDSSSEYNPYSDSRSYFNIQDTATNEARTSVETRRHYELAAERGEMITAGNVPIAKYVPYCPPMAMPPPADMPTYRQPSPPTMKRKRDDDDDEAIITRPAPPTGNLGASALSRLPPRTKQQALCDHHGWFNPKVYQDEYQYQLVCQLRLSEAFTREGKKCHGDRQMQYGIQCGKCAIIMCRICNRLANPVHSQRKLNTGVKNANRNRKRQRRS